ncbi:MAG TPA: DUF1508 domain-containing protein [Jiangellaceae bacterium]
MYFAIRKSKTGQYWWRIVGDNDEIMGASELMTTKASVESAIATIQADASTAKVLDQTHLPIDPEPGIM